MKDHILEFEYENKDHKILLTEQMIEEEGGEFSQSFSSNEDIFDLYYNEEYGDICVYWVDMDQEDGIGLAHLDFTVYKKEI